MEKDFIKKVKQMDFEELFYTLISRVRHISYLDYRCEYDSDRSRVAVQEYDIIKHELFTRYYQSKKISFSKEFREPYQY
jgi:hypothetical protein